MARHHQIAARRKTPKKIIYLACEGGSAGAEGTYVKDLCDKYGCTRIPISKDHKDPVTLAAIAIDFSRNNPRRNGKFEVWSEIWIVFDNDAPLEVKKAFNAVATYNKTKKPKCMDVNIAYNAPTIETFGLLCCGITKISVDRAKNQSKLRDCMNGYDHDASPRFDFDQMERGYADAASHAKNWAITFKHEPEYRASKFAGIYRLAENIKNTQ